MPDDETAEVEGQLLRLVQADGIERQGPEEPLLIRQGVAFGPTEDVGVVSGEECEDGSFRNRQGRHFHADVFGIQGVGTPAGRWDGE